MFLLPADCAKVVAINDGDPYIVEGAYIFCDIENPVLLYIRNYFTGKYVFQVVENKREELTTMLVLGILLFSINTHPK